MESSVLPLAESIRLTVPCPERKWAVQFENCPKPMLFQVQVRPVPAGSVCTIWMSTLFICIVEDGDGRPIATVIVIAS